MGGEEAAINVLSISNQVLLSWFSIRSDMIILMSRGVLLVYNITENA